MLFWILDIDFVLPFPEDIKLVDGIDDKKWNKWKEEGWIIKIK